MTSYYSKPDSLFVPMCSSEWPVLVEHWVRGEVRQRGAQHNLRHLWSWLGMLASPQHNRRGGGGKLEKNRCVLALTGNGMEEVNAQEVAMFQPQPFNLYLAVSGWEARSQFWSTRISVIWFSWWFSKHLRDSIEYFHLQNPDLSQALCWQHDLVPQGRVTPQTEVMHL